MCALLENITHFLDSLQLLMLLVGTLAYLESEPFLLIIFYNIWIVKILNMLKTYMKIYVFI
jgi:hypothetical protein